MEDYYLDEMSVIIREWNALHSPQRGDAPAERVDPRAFFGDSGEVVG